MLNSLFQTWLASTPRAMLLAVWLIAGAVLPVAASAVEVPSLFTAQVPLNHRLRNPRDAAIRDALDEVLMRVSGAELVNDRDLVDALFPDPGSYMVQFRPAEDDQLWVRFDGDAIESVLRRSGQAVWGSDRPATVLWIAVDWGRGERQIVGADDNLRGPGARRTADRNRQLRERILEAAERRGIPVFFPLLDAEDLENVSFSDIWGGFHEPIYAASERYDVNSVLIGRVSAASSQRNRWTYSFAGDEQFWNGEPEAVINLISERLASEFAIEGNAPVRRVDLRVGGIDSIAAYGEIQNVLSDAGVIERFSIDEVIGDTIRYSVDVHGGAERLRRALRYAGLVEGDVFDGDFGSDIDFDDSGSTSLQFYFDP
ncbi:MAG: DUF2066 domain-containing protein [Pseudomonadota bacterium]